jgi:hypothetical protein
MLDLGRLLLIAGVILIILGAALSLGSQLGLGLGRLLGDIQIVHNGGSVYIPVTTSLLLSVLLTVLLNALLRMFRKQIGGLELTACL